MTSLRKACLAALLAAPLAACAGGTPQNLANGQAAQPTPAGKPAVAKSGAVLAKFGDETLTEGELTAKLNEKSPFERARMNTLDRKKEQVEQIVRFDLLAQEAKRRGLDQDPDVVKAMQTVMVRKLVQAEIDENPDKKKFEDSELKAYYDGHLEDFQRPEMARLAVIALAAPDQAGAEKRKKEGEAIAKELKAKQNDYAAFGAAVAAKSEDLASKQTQGDLHFLSKQQLTERYGETAANAAFGLGQNAVSDALVTPKGVMIFKLLGRTPPVNQSFEQSKATLTQRVWYEKRNKLFEEFMKSLKDKANYNLDEAALDKFQVQTTAPTTNLASLNSPTGLPPAPTQGLAKGPMAQPVPAKMNLPMQPAHGSAPAPAPGK